MAGGVTEIVDIFFILLVQVKPTFPYLSKKNFVRYINSVALQSSVFFLQMKPFRIFQLGTGDKKIIIGGRVLSVLN